VSFAHTLKIETAAPLAMRRSESQATKSSGQFRRRSIPKTILRKMSRALRRRGMDVTDNRMIANRFAGLVPAPDLIIDVGVAAGTPWLYDAFPDSRFLLIDPMVECRQNVTAAFPNLDAQFQSVALGDSRGEIELNIPTINGSVRGSKSSVLTRSDHISPTITNWETRTVTVELLDNLTPKDGRFGLKIDTEGAESAILRGAAETLSRCDFVVLELSLSKRFEEVEPPSTAISLLRDAGLEMRDVLSVNSGTSTKSPPHIDCLFTRWSA
jgi:FkbM family methyltransferase